MAHDESPELLSNDEAGETDPSYWSGARLVLAGVIVVAALGVIAVMLRPHWDRWQEHEADAAWYEQAKRELNERLNQKPKPRSAVNDEILSRFDTDGLDTDLRQRIFNGGPRKDSIPALTTEAAAQAVGQTQHGPPRTPQWPKFVPAKEALFPANTRVVGLTVGGQSRAYPIPIIVWHEIVNDLLGTGDDKTPVLVVYCPLCDSVSVAERRLGGKTYEFGVSGMLTNSNVLLYDRMDNALWSQIGFEAVSGPNVGKSLKHLDGWELTTLDKWTKRHPNSTVLTMETGFANYQSRYERQAYATYFRHDRLMFPIEHQSARLGRQKVPVVGVRVGDIAKAYPLEAVRKDATEGVFKDELADGVVQLSVDDESVQVVQTPAGAQAVHTYWFAWYAFYPKTELYESAADAGGN